MDKACDNIKITFNKKNQKIRKSIKDYTISTKELVKSCIYENSLISLNATYDNENWAIDVYCDKEKSYIVIIDVSRGITYTYLNPDFAKTFMPDNYQLNIYTCLDKNKYLMDATPKAMEMSNINGQDCPALHICNDRNELYDIITNFLENGTLFGKSCWLKDR